MLELSNGTEVVLVRGKDFHVSTSDAIVGGMGSDRYVLAVSSFREPDVVGTAAYTAITGGAVSVTGKSFYDDICAKLSKEGRAKAILYVANATGETIERREIESLAEKEVVPAVSDLLEAAVAASRENPLKAGLVVAGIWILGHVSEASPRLFYAISAKPFPKGIVGGIWEGRRVSVTALCATLTLEDELLERLVQNRLWLSAHLGWQSLDLHEGGETSLGPMLPPSSSPSAPLGGVTPDLSSSPSPPLGGVTPDLSSSPSAALGGVTPDLSLSPSPPLGGAAPDLSSSPVGRVGVVDVSGIWHGHIDDGETFTWTFSDGIWWSCSPYWRSESGGWSWLVPGHTLQLAYPDGRVKCLVELELDGNRFIPYKNAQGRWVTITR